MTADALAQSEVTPARRLPLEPWRDAVRVSTFALGLIELPSTRFLELSPSAKALLGPGTDGARGLDFMDPAEQADVTEIVRLASTGALDGTQSRRRWRRKDGSSLDIRTWGRTIRRTGDGDVGLWAAYELTPLSVREGAGFSIPGEYVPRRLRSEAGLNVGAVTRLNERWQVSAIDGAEDLLGHTFEALAGRALIDLTHPDDVPALLFAFARATSDVHARSGIRLRHVDGTWRAVEMSLTLSDAVQPFELALTLADVVADRGANGGRAAELPARSRPIAADALPLESVAQHLSASRDFATAGLDGLSPRQAEILNRLLQGQRVPMIAREMFLSASTVRNHLSMTFRKFGVHSQQELITRLRQGERPPSGGPTS